MSTTMKQRKQTSPRQTAAAVKAALTRAGLTISRTTGRFAHYGHGTRVTTRGLGIFQHGASASVTIHWREGSGPGQLETWDRAVTATKLAEAYAALVAAGFFVLRGDQFLTLHTKYSD